jgi:hypothetical protein
MNQLTNEPMNQMNTQAELWLIGQLAHWLIV